MTLQVTKQIAHDLGLSVTAVTPAKIATGHIVQVPSATALAVMEGRTVYVTVLISEGMPLLGISFLEKFSYTAIVDCKNKTVALDISR